jgi:hypothetical protein
MVTSAFTPRRIKIQKALEKPSAIFTSDDLNQTKRAHKQLELLMRSSCFPQKKSS